MNLNDYERQNNNTNTIQTLFGKLFLGILLLGAISFLYVFANIFLDIGAETEAEEEIIQRRINNYQSDKDEFERDRQEYYEEHGNYGGYRDTWGGISGD